jgi:hypothetical protein
MPTTIHWVGTETGDDPEGSLAKLREGFDKWLNDRHPGGLTVYGCANASGGGRVVRAHALSLAHPSGAKRLQASGHERLIDRHGRAIMPTTHSS